MAKHLNVMPCTQTTTNMTQVPWQSNQPRACCNCSCRGGRLPRRQHMSWQAQPGWGSQAYRAFQCTNTSSRKHLRKLAKKLSAAGMASRMHQGAPSTIAYVQPAPPLPTHTPVKNSLEAAVQSMYMQEVVTSGRTHASCTAPSMGARHPRVRQLRRGLAQVTGRQKTATRHIQSSNSKRQRKSPKASSGTAPQSILQAARHSVRHPVVRGSATALLHNLSPAWVQAEARLRQTPLAQVMHAT
jgi:hypothetical protein